MVCKRGPVKSDGASSKCSHNFVCKRENQWKLLGSLASVMIFLCTSVCKRGNQWKLLCNLKKRETKYLLFAHYRRFWWPRGKLAHARCVEDPVVIGPRQDQAFGLWPSTWWAVLSPDKQERTCLLPLLQCQVYMCWISEAPHPPVAHGPASVSLWEVWGWLHVQGSLRGPHEQAQQHAHLSVHQVPQEVHLQRGHVQTSQAVWRPRASPTGQLELTAVYLTSISGVSWPDNMNELSEPVHWTDWINCKNLSTRQIE